jgi:hypothetical protein
MSALANASRGAFSRLSTHQALLCNSVSSMSSTSFRISTTNNRNAKCPCCSTCSLGSCNCTIGNVLSTHQHNSINHQCGPGCRHFTSAALHNHQHNSVNHQCGPGCRHFTSAAAARASNSGDNGFAVPPSVSGVKSSDESLLKPAKKIDFSDKRRKEISWRAKQRGWLEVDWIIGNFASEKVINSIFSISSLKNGGNGC